MTLDFVVEKSLVSIHLRYVSPTNSSPGLPGLPLEFTRYIKTHSTPKVVCSHDLGYLLEPIFTNSMNSIQGPFDPNQALLIVIGITALQLRTETKYNS